MNDSEELTIGNFIKTEFKPNLSYHSFYKSKFIFISR